MRREKKEWKGRVKRKEKSKREEKEKWRRDGETKREEKKRKTHEFGFFKFIYIFLLQKFN